MTSIYFNSNAFSSSSSLAFARLRSVHISIITNHILFPSSRLITEILKKISMDCVAIAFDKLSNWMPLSDLSERKETVKPTMSDDDDDDDCIALE